MPYAVVPETDKVNADFEEVEMVLVIIAKDSDTSAAVADPNNAIAGMLVLEVGFKFIWLDLLPLTSNHMNLCL